MTSFLQKLSIFIATGFGIGYILPIGQGSLAALAAIFFVRSFLDLSFLSQTLLIFIGIIVGVFISSAAEKKLGTKDDHRIVIDEMVSIFITFWGLGPDLSVSILIIGFVLNRLLDVWKPWLIKRLQNLPNGWGVMLDDVASAILSNIVLKIILLI